MRLVWRAPALEDLETIISYIAERDAAAASRLHDAIEKCAEALKEHPRMFRAGRVSGTREAVVHPNYILVYEVGDDQVTITAVVHSRRQFP